MKKKQKLSDKTPLQQWAWKRYMLKGVVTGFRTHCSQRRDSEVCTRKEKDHLLRMIRILDDMFNTWDEQQELSRQEFERREVRRNKSAIEPKLTINSNYYPQ